MTHLTEPDLRVISTCARAACGQVIVRCSCGRCPFSGWLHAQTGRHLCTHNRAALVKALASLSAVA